MKSLLRYKALLATFVMALLMVVMGSAAEAKTISRKYTYDTEYYQVGSEYSMSGYNIKINSKSLKKYRKKVKAVNYSSYEGNNSYRKGGFYDSYRAYKAGTSSEDSYGYYGESGYSFRFLKAGTYKFSNVTYSNSYSGYSVYDMKYNGDGTYTLQQCTYSKDKGYYYKNVGSEKYVYKTIDTVKSPSYYNDYGYYQGTKNKKIYADHDDYGIVPATFKTGADGYKHMYYSPVVVKTTYVYPIKVTKPSPVVSAITLGKSKVTTSYSHNGYASTNKYVSKKFLSKTKGKLTVKMGSNYSLTSILVVTYDKNGDAIFSKVRNKQTINFGKYKNKYSDSYSSYSSMYKPTQVYVYYKNKQTGAYYKITDVKKDEDGDYKISYEYRYSKDGEKYTSYNWNYAPSGCRVSYTFYKK